jgi:hypothetical protein
MADILSFKAAAKKRDNKKQSLDELKERTMDLAGQAAEELIEQWCDAFEARDIDGLIARRLGVHPDAYISDLNKISSLEAHVGIELMQLSSPNSFVNDGIQNDEGWMVTFWVKHAELVMPDYDDEQDADSSSRAFMSPEMDTEHFARVFAVMMYHDISKIIRDAVVEYGRILGLPPR